MSAALVQDALVALIDARIQAALSARPRTHFSQHDGERPPWARTPLVFLRAHRVLVAEGHPGVAAIGKLRTMTPEAADEWAARKKLAPRLTVVAEPAPVTPARSLEDELLEELGARRTASR